MDNKYKLLQKFANSEEDQANRAANQSIVEDELKRAQLNPDQQQYYDFMQRQKLLNTQPHDPLVQPPTQLSPEEAAILDTKAQEARKKYDALINPSQQPLQGAVDLTPRFPNLNKLVRK